MALRSALLICTTALLHCGLWGFWISAASAESVRSTGGMGHDVLEARLQDRVTTLEAEIAELTESIAWRKALLANVGSEFERFEKTEAKLLKRMAELEARTVDAEQSKRARIVALYRAGRLGSPRVLRDEASQIKARRLSRYMAALAEHDDGRDQAAEVEQGSVLTELDQVRTEAAGTERQSRDLELELRTDEHALVQAKSRLSGAHTDLALLAEAANAPAQPVVAQVPPGNSRGIAADAASEAPLGSDDPFEFPALGDGPLVIALGGEASDQPGAEPGAEPVEESDESIAAAADAQRQREAELELQAERKREREDQERQAKLDLEAEKERERKLEDLARREQEARAQEQAKKAEEAARLRAEAAKKGFPALKGLLLPPLRGRVIARFGQKHTSGTVYRGLIVRGEPSSQVVATAAGEVVFSGPFPGLGDTVILAHGERYHSVYARLASANVAIGAKVESGASVGVMPDDNGDLHFEMRQAGKAFDPLVWFASGADAFAP